MRNPISNPRSIPRQTGLVLLVAGLIVASFILYFALERATKLLGAAAPARPEISKPPIDSAVPARTTTATFAMG